MNVMEFTMTVRSERRSCATLSTPVPEISDTYPGTSGSTHGDKNESRPATKAVMGSGVPDISRYFTFPGDSMCQNSGRYKRVAGRWSMADGFCDLAIGDYRAFRHTAGNHTPEDWRLATED
jgi:hypothetical protein